MEVVSTHHSDKGPEARFRPGIALVVTFRWMKLPVVVKALSGEVGWSQVPMSFIAFVERIYYRWLET